MLRCLLNRVTEKIRLINYTEGLVGAGEVQDVFLLGPEILPWVGFFVWLGFWVWFWFVLFCFIWDSAALAGREGASWASRELPARKNNAARR